MQGKVGKVACKASSQIGSCAWRLMGRQPANKSGSLHCCFTLNHDDDGGGGGGNGGGDGGGGGGDGDGGDDLKAGSLFYNLFMMMLKGMLGRR